MGLISKKISTKAPIRYKPETKDELIDIIVYLLQKGQTNLNCIDVSKMTDTSGIFREANNKVTVKDIDISEWDVSHVTDMHGMFDGCKEFNANLSKWNVSNVTNMNCMFYGCKEFNSDLSNWDVYNVEQMPGMFEGCKQFNSDLSNWNVSNVTDMYEMFFNCENFNSDLSKWDISDVTDMYNMLYGCTTLKKNNKIPDWYNGTN